MSTGGGNTEHVTPACINFPNIYTNINIYTYMCVCVCTWSTACSSPVICTPFIHVPRGHVPLLRRCPALLDPLHLDPVLLGFLAEGQPDAAGPTALVYIIADFAHIGSNRRREADVTGCRIPWPRSLHRRAAVLHSCCCCLIPFWRLSRRGGWRCGGCRAHEDDVLGLANAATDNLERGFCACVPQRQPYVSM